MLIQRLCCFVLFNEKIQHTYAPSLFSILVSSYNIYPNSRYDYKYKFSFDKDQTIHYVHTCSLKCSTIVFYKKNISQVRYCVVTLFLLRWLCLFNAVISAHLHALVVVYKQFNYVDVYFWCRLYAVVVQIIVSLENVTVAKLSVLLSQRHLQPACT